MRYIVFSFDDGLLDFKEYALLIMNRFGFKCTINIISGFSDGTVETDNQYLSVSDIKELHNNGFDVANHTNGHARGGSYKELFMCNKKIQDWCNTKTTVGIAMPKYVGPTSDAKRFIKECKPSYITYEKKDYSAYLRVDALLAKLKYLFKKDNMNFYKYSHKIKMYKKGKAFYFRRFNVGPTIDPTILFNSLYSIRNNYCLTICFHSIVEEVNNCDYPKGAWTPAQFSIFCELLSDHKSDFAVITQEEACGRQ